MLEKVSVIVALIGPLAAGNQLHRSVDQERLDEGLEFEFASLSGVAMLGLGSVKIYHSQRAGQSSDGGIGNSLIRREIRMRNVIFNMAVGGEECAGAYENYGIPLEVVSF